MYSGTLFFNSQAYEIFKGTISLKTFDFKYFLTYETDLQNVGLLSYRLGNKLFYHSDRENPRKQNNCNRNFFVLVVLYGILKLTKIEDK